MRNSFLNFSHRVSHLILVDPWGFPERAQTQTDGGENQGTEVVKKPALPRWVKAVAAVVSLFNPLAVIRAAGPWGKMCRCRVCWMFCVAQFSVHLTWSVDDSGPGLVNRFRPDFKRKFEDLFDDDTMTQYIYHCNAQTPRQANMSSRAPFLNNKTKCLQCLTTSSVSFPCPSGEVGFRAMSESLGWAKRPMLERVHLLPPSMPLTMLYGEWSWVDHSSGDLVAQIRNQAHTRVTVRCSCVIYAPQLQFSSYSVLLFYRRDSLWLYVLCCAAGKQSLSPRVRRSTGRVQQSSRQYMQLC